MHISNFYCYICSKFSKNDLEKQIKMSIISEKISQFSKKEKAKFILAVQIKLGLSQRCVYDRIAKDKWSPAETQYIMRNIL